MNPNITCLEALRAWLIWNDPNGVYCDTELLSEGFPILTLENALQMITEQLDPTH